MGEKNRPLTGKVVWVTGSSRGIGRVIATHMASLGANVAVHGTTPFSTRVFNEADSLEAVAKTIAAEQGVDVLPVHGDLSDESTVKTAAKQIRERFGPMDVVVNNAEEETLDLKEPLVRVEGSLPITMRSSSLLRISEPCSIGIS
jgi:NAD(P)-dependent dehydrogenase (short-subunit alcohol dehydrogenase family)